MKAGPKHVSEATASIEGRLFFLDAFFRLFPKVERIDSLLEALCTMLVQYRPYCLAAVGRAQSDGSIEVVAAAGYARGYLEGIKVRWDSSPEGLGPAGRAIASQSAVLVSFDEKSFAPWSARAANFGIGTIAAAPVEFEDGSKGVLSVYTDRDRDFLQDELPFIELLSGILRLRQSLSLEESRAGRRLQRLETLWHLNVHAGFDDEDRMRAVLREGALALGSQMNFRGEIGQLDGADLIVEVTTIDEAALRSGEGKSARQPAALREHERVPLAITVCSHIVAAGKTSSWEDLAANPATAETARVQQVGWRSAIGTVFRVNDRRYTLIFLSRQPCMRQFDDEDHAYVETLAAFFERAFYEREQEARIRFQAQHDALTGLMNRTRFHELLQETLRRVATAGERCALLFLDLDNFKEINDTYGHLAGDAVLIAVADRLGKNLRDREIVARLGGDEFAILVPKIDDNFAIERQAQRLCETFQRPFITAERTLLVTASIGIALFPTDGRHVAELFARADAAMYRAKQAGRARHQFYNEAIDSELHRRREFQQELRGAVERDEFLLYYQPQVDLRSGRVTGAEALLRWNHPRKGIVPPDSFVSFCEELGLMNKLGTWVMHQAARDAARFSKAKQDLRVSINVSAVQLSDAAFLRELTKTVSSGAPLDIEITEKVAMSDPLAAMRILTEVKALGSLIALDDFGTGYSSLAYLKRLPIDVIKIDRSFVEGLPHEADDAAIVQAVISVAHKLGRTVLAEGVETAAQAEWLVKEGCLAAQGFLFAKPMTAAALEHWLAENAESTAAR